MIISRAKRLNRKFLYFAQWLYNILCNLPKKFKITGQWEDVSKHKRDATRLSASVPLFSCAVYLIQEERDAFTSHVASMYTSYELKLAALLFLRRFNQFRIRFTLFSTRSIPPSGSIISSGRFTALSALVSMTSSKPRMPAVPTEASATLTMTIICWATVKRILSHNVRH